MSGSRLYSVVCIHAACIGTASIYVLLPVVVYENSIIAVKPVPRGYSTTLFIMRSSVFWKRVWSKVVPGYLLVV